MIDAREFRLGDIETWIDYSGRWSESEEVAMKEYFTDDFAIKLLADGVRPSSEKIKKFARIENEENVLRLRDTISGLPFIYDRDKLQLDTTIMFSPEFDIIDSCYYRKKLSKMPKSGGGFTFTNTFTSSALDRYGINSFEYLSNEIVEYSVNSKEELNDTIKSIQTELEKGSYFKRLWLRGQKEEYLGSRNIEVSNFLGFENCGINQPSMLPSLGRFLKNNPTTLEEKYAILGSSYRWEKPFIIWVIRNNPEWLDHYPEFKEKVEDSLVSSDPSDFSRVLGEIRFDERVPTEVDDLRQWFPAFLKYGSFVLALQQYGYMTSMLDVTWDIETALFFTHTQMKNSKFEFVEPTQERVIYVYAESKESSSFNDSEDIDWGDSDWNLDIPTRIEAQNCGALVGSTEYRQCQYTNLIIAKIKLSNNEIKSNRSIEDVFPSNEDDLFLKTLEESVPRPEGLY